MMKFNAKAKAEAEAPAQYPHAETGAIVGAATASIAAPGEAQEDGEAVGMGESAKGGGKFPGLHISIVIEI